MYLRMKCFAGLAVVLVWLIVFPAGTKPVLASCGEAINNQGPYYTLHCYEDNDCDDYGEDLTCEEEDCENCLHKQTGYSTFCVESYDCGVISGCYTTMCT
jgi:hypothetical protein